jgi:hypothetical protein
MFRFTIRELVLLTIIVALTVGWWAHAKRLQGQADEMTVRTEMLTGALEHLGMYPSFKPQSLVLSKTKRYAKGWEGVVVQRADYITTDGRPRSRKHPLFSDEN